MPKEVTWLELINPTERQLDAFKAVAEFDYVLYGGAAGGGKSRFLRWVWPWYLIQLYKNFGLRNVQVALMCEDYPSLYDRQISKIKYEFPEALGTLRMGDVKSFQLKEEFGGGIIALRNLDDPSKYLSAEFAGIGIDELTKNKKDVFDFLRLRLRWPGVERPKFIGATNPGGPGHAWVKALWVDHEFPKELEPLKEQFRFIPALATDNKHLTKQYWENLNTLPTEMRKAYAEGNWNVFAGQYFDIWDVTKHLSRPEEFGLKQWTTRWIGMDWGFKHPASVHWFAQLRPAETVTYREFYRNGISPKVLAEKVVELNDGEDIAAIYLSPDAFAKRTDADTIAQQLDTVFRSNGLPSCTPANDDRVGGWTLMYDYLRTGRWVIGSNCTELAKVLPMLSRDEKKVEDVQKFDGDDAADSCFVVGTKILTQRGEIPIEEITIEDNVATRLGWKSVLSCGATKESAAVVTLVISDGRTITGTPNHPVFFNSDYFPLDSMRYGDRVQVWQLKPLSSMELGSAVTPTQSTCSIENTSSPAVTLKAKDFSIGVFGRRLMALFRKAMMFTIKTKIHSTIYPVISNACQKLSIIDFTASNKSLIFPYWNVFALSPLNGMVLQRELNGTEITPRTQSDYVKRSSYLVTSAGLHSLDGRIKAGSVQTPANPDGEGNQDAMMLKHFAPIAARDSCGTVIEDRNAAPAVVLGISIKIEPQKVYNLEVADAHEYIANGILVHNCRYGLRSHFKEARMPFEQRVAEKVEALAATGASTTQQMMALAKIRHDERKAAPASIPLRRNWRWARR